MGTPTTTRAANACESCRQRKVKCSGDQPCRRCARHSWECTFGLAGRRRYSEAHVQGLLDRIRAYEERLQSLSDARPVPTTSATTTSPSLPNEPTAGTIPQPDSDVGITPTTDLTSGPAFESQVKSLLDRVHGNHGGSTTASDSSSSPQGMEAQWTSARALVNDDAVVILPSLKESQHLLERFLFYLGVSQHFFDPRTFSDRMMLLYQEERTRDGQMHATWFTEYLLVMAMAKLMDVEDPSSQPPGASFFAEALKRLAPLHQLGEEGVIAVEILTLIATYLQWCDRKHDAYLYIGLALRLAIALGCDNPVNEQGCLPSQAAHRVRLWWTVYMLDRRLSSGLGFAAGADERQLRAALPQQAIGFQSPVALAINVRIARTTDDLMSSLYGNASITQMDLVQKVQRVLHDLYDIGRSLPHPLALDFGRPLQTVTRTGASLHLMLFQAIILCIRPILLQRVRQEVESQTSHQPQTVPTVLSRLCETCNEAATKSLAILYALQRQKIIPRYGFFDLDATFSAAFVLVMMGFVDQGRSQPPPALDQAFVVLRFLSRAGNRAAERRLDDITHSCLRVWPDYTPRESQPDGRKQKKVADADASPSEWMRMPPPPPAIPREPNRQDHFQDESALLEMWMHPDTVLGTFDAPGQWDLDLSVEAEGIYSSFYDPTLPLTGIDHSDWLEIEKLFDRQNR